jgi:uncharacterized protein with von Willebrand factor type A (vWA) domain
MIRMSNEVLAFAERTNTKSLFEKFADLWNHYLAVEHKKDTSYDKDFSFEEKSSKLNEDIKNTKNRLDNNIRQTGLMFEKVYDRMEKGELNRKDLELTEESIFNLNRFPDIGIVRLFGNKKNTNTENINLEMTEKTHHSDSEQEFDEKHSQKSDLENYRMNVDVVSYSEKK